MQAGGHQRIPDDDHVVPDAVCHSARVRVPAAGLRVSIVSSYLPIPSRCRPSSPISLQAFIAYLLGTSTARVGSRRRHDKRVSTAQCGVAGDQPRPILACSRNLVAEEMLFPDAMDEESIDLQVKFLLDGADSGVPDQALVLVTNHWRLPDRWVTPKVDGRLNDVTN